LNNLYSVSKKLIFLRHCESTANAAKFASGGDRNPKLTPKGIEQAHAAANALVRLNIKPSLILASSLIRTLDTANIINSYLQVDLIIHDSLKERFLGDWNDISSHIINPKLQAGDTPPNGESRREFRKRTIDYLSSQSSIFYGMPLIVGSRGLARLISQFVVTPTDM